METWSKVYWNMDTYKNKKSVAHRLYVLSHHMKEIISSSWKCFSKEDKILLATSAILKSVCGTNKKLQLIMFFMMAYAQISSSTLSLLHHLILMPQKRNGYLMIQSFQDRLISSSFSSHLHKLHLITLKYAFSQSEILSASLSHWKSSPGELQH